MSYLSISEGDVSRRITVFMENATTGEGMAGIANTDIQAFMKREGGTWTEITTINAVAEGVYGGNATEAGWVACGGASADAGEYEFHAPNNAFLAEAGVKAVYFKFKAAGAKVSRYVCELGPFDVTLPTNIELMAIDANGRVDVSLIEGVDATDQIAANSGSGTTAAAIADAVWDEARAGHAAAGTFGEGVASVQGNVAGNVEGSVVGTVADVVAAVDANVVAIEGQDPTDQIAAASSGSVDVGSIAGSAQAATNLSLSAQKLIVGNALTVTATEMTANIAVDGDFVGATIVWDNGSRAVVTSYSLALGVGTFGYAALASPPSGTPAFVIY